VVKGFIDEIELVKAPEHFKEDLIALFAPILSQKPVQMSWLERQLLLANDLPGLTLSGTLSRPEEAEAGATKLLLTAELQSFETSLEVNNRDSRYVGPWQGSVWGAANSLVRLGDQLSLSAATTSTVEELMSVGLGYSIPLGWMDSRLSSYANWTGGKPGEELRDLEVEVGILTMGVDLSVPLIRRRNDRLTATASFEAQNGKTDILGTRISTDRTRVLGLTFDYGNAGWLEDSATSLQLKFRKGLDVLKARDGEEGNASRGDGKADFTLLSASLSHNQLLWGNWSSFLATTGQYSFDPLLAGHEFALGGEDFGRAYDRGEIVGDHGITAGAEIRYNFDSVFEWLPSLQLYSFADWGAAWEYREADFESLASTGAGFRASTDFGFEFSLEYAHALTKTPSQQYEVGDGRIFFRARQSF